MANLPIQTKILTLKIGQIQASFSESVLRLICSLGNRQDLCSWAKCYFNCFPKPSTRIYVCDFPKIYPDPLSAANKIIRSFGYLLRIRFLERMHAAISRSVVGWPFSSATTIAATVACSCNLVQNRKFSHPNHFQPSMLGLLALEQSRNRRWILILMI